MRRLVTASVVFACVTGFNLSTTATTPAFAEEGWSRSTPMGFRPASEPIAGRGGPRPWFHEGEGRRAWSISLMLQSKEQLGLSAEQIHALKARRDGFQRDAIARHAQIALAVLDLQALREQEPTDLPRVEAQVRRIALLRADRHIAHIKLILDSKAILTPEQREHWKQLAPAHRMGRDGRDIGESGMRSAPPSES